MSRALAQMWGPGNSNKKLWEWQPARSHVSHRNGDDLGILHWNSSVYHHKTCFHMFSNVSTTLFPQMWCDMATGHLTPAEGFPENILSNLRFDMLLARVEMDGSKQPFNRHIRFEEMTHISCNKPGTSLMLVVFFHAGLCFFSCFFVWFTGGTCFSLTTYCHSSCDLYFFSAGWLEGSQNDRQEKTDLSEKNMAKYSLW